MMWLGHVARMGEVRNVCKSLVMNMNGNQGVWSIILKCIVNK